MYAINTCQSPQRVKMYILLKNLFKNKSGLNIIRFKGCEKYLQFAPVSALFFIFKPRTKFPYVFLEQLNHGRE